MKLIESKRIEPQVFYTPVAWQQIQLIVATCKKEVAWIGLGDETQRDIWLIDEIILLPQEVSAMECEFEDDAVADWAEEMLKAGKDTTRWVLWGHSHVDMTVTPSATDVEQARLYLNCPKFICAIHNKHGNINTDVYNSDEGVWFDDVYTAVHIEPLTKKQVKAVKDSIKLNVKDAPVVTYPKKGAVTNVYGHVTQTPAVVDYGRSDEDFVAPNFKLFDADGFDEYGLTLKDYKDFWEYYHYNGNKDEVYDDIYGGYTGGVYGAAWNTNDYSG